MNFEKLELNIFLSTLNGDLSAKNKLIYSSNIIDIPIASVIDGIIWISLDMRIKKSILKLVKKLVEENKEFYITSKNLVYKIEIFEENLEQIIDAYFDCLYDEEFFSKLKKTGVDYENNLSEFVVNYGCFRELHENYKILKKYFEGDHWYYKRRKPHSKKMKDYVMSFKRLIDLKMISSQL